MFCSKCGNKLEDGSAFCGKCGEKFEAAGTAPAAAPGAPAKKKSNKALFIVLFGCLGLMVAVPVVGILAAIAIPRFAQMLEKSREGATKGNLAAIRSSVSIYYTEKNGVWPPFAILGTAEYNNYLCPIPPEKITNSNKIVNKFDGTGGWYYCDDKTSKDYGKVFVNLDRNDTKGVPFKDY